MATNAVGTVPNSSKFNSSCMDSRAVCGNRGLNGAIVGVVEEKLLSASKDGQPSTAGEGEIPKSFPLGPGFLLGGAIGFMMGACYSLYRDHYVHFQLRTDLVGEDGNTARQVALQKVNTIFKTYANKKFGDDSGLCDEVLTFNLFIYPVEAGDGKIYEHSAICHYLTVNYPIAVQAYENKRREFPNDPTVLPPSSSPVGYGNVTLNNLKLHPETMKDISKKMAGFFKDLRQWESQIQPAS